MLANSFPIGATNVSSPVRNNLNTNCVSLGQKRTRRGKTGQNGLEISCKGNLSVTVTGTVLVLS